MQIVYISYTPMRYDLTPKPNSDPIQSGSKLSIYFVDKRTNLLEISWNRVLLLQIKIDVLVVEVRLMVYSTKHCIIRFT